MSTDFEQVEGLEVAVVRGVEGDQDRHDLAQAELSGAITVDTSMSDQLLLPPGQKTLTEVIDMTEHGQ